MSNTHACFDRKTTHSSFDLDVTLAGTLDPALGGTAPTVLQDRISSLAGQAMNRLFGFGRAPSGPEGTPNCAIGTPLDSRPAVPSSLLSEGHSTAM